jgi:hypothetical protein
MVIVGLPVAICGLGCGAESVPSVTPSSGHLIMIGLAYIKATETLNHAPRNKDELVPFLKREPDPDDPDKPVPEIDLDDLFRSPTDRQDYVIHWGLDYREYGGPPRKLPVLAYEKEGKDGKRVVLQVRYAHTVTEEQLANLPFPPGFPPP